MFFVMLLKQLLNMKIFYFSRGVGVGWMPGKSTRKISIEWSYSWRGGGRGGGRGRGSGGGGLQKCFLVGKGLPQKG